MSWKRNSSENSSCCSCCNMKFVSMKTFFFLFFFPLVSSGNFGDNYRLWDAPRGGLKRNARIRPRLWLLHFSTITRNVPNADRPGAGCQGEKISQQKDRLTNDFQIDVFYLTFTAWLYSYVLYLSRQPSDEQSEKLMCGAASGTTVLHVFIFHWNLL